MKHVGKKNEELSTFYHTLKKGYVSIKGDFLLPPEYSVGHAHKWITLDAGYCICQHCGLDHVCFQGNCPVVSMEHSEQVCSISGCVILKTEMRPEWGAVERTTGAGKILSIGGEDDVSKCYSTNSNSVYNYYDEDNMESSSKRRKNEQCYMKSTDEFDTFSSKNNRSTDKNTQCSKRGRPSLHPNSKKRKFSSFQDHEPSGKRGRKSAQTERHPLSGTKMKRRGRTQHPQSHQSFFTNNNSNMWRDPDVHQHNMKKVLKGNMEVHEFVEMVVRDILDSQKTLQCRGEEMSRDKTRKIACLAKIIRESSASEYFSTCQRPNMIEIEAKLSWLCRKFRYHSYYYHDRVHEHSIHMMQSIPKKNKKNAPALFRAPLPLMKAGKNKYYDFQIKSTRVAKKHTRLLERVIQICVENITRLIRAHGWHRVHRQLQHATRGKEFICSMLYLMRMGITFRNQNILQKVEVLNELLPMQVFLPTVFNIRAKSITEGENLIKMDILRMPLAS